MRQNLWLPADVDAAKSLFDKGLSYRQIADAMGDRTFNSVAGVFRKLGITRRPIQTQTKAFKRGQGGRKRNTGFNPTFGQPPARPPPARSEAWIALPGSTPRPMLQAPSMACKWPIDGPDGAILFCCNPRKPLDKSYCERHRQISTGGL